MPELAGIQECRQAFHGIGMKFYEHNHPGGSPQASRDDLDLTETVARALAAVGVDVLDHIIVARGQYYSLAQKGLIKGKLS